MTMVMTMVMTMERCDRVGGGGRKDIKNHNEGQMRVKDYGRTAVVRGMVTSQRLKENRPLCRRGRKSEGRSEEVIDTVTGRKWVKGNPHWGKNMNQK